MCGIAGWCAERLSPEGAAAVVAVAGRLAHRGPDDHAAWLRPEEGIALAHRRLAIIDLSPGSRQPMIDEARGLVLAYNGEIYNFRELRAELENLGERFTTTGDVEVLLKAFAAWGEKSFARLAGMFALAIWSARDRTLWLARDAMGMKPLYLWRPPAGGITFASEARALAALPGFEARIRPESLREYLEFGYVFSERETIFEGVEKLPPAEVVAIRDGRIVRRFRHFEPPRPEPSDRRSGAGRVEELSSCLETVVAQHLIADVPVGLLLSGGLDSSLVAALAARRESVTTVSMGFADSAHDERPWGARVARAIGSRHHEVLIAPGEVAAEIEECAAIFDDLFADWGTVTTRILYRKCRELGLKVVLVGEGSDEIFAGYPVFEPAARSRAGDWALFQLYRRYASRRYGSLFGRFRSTMRELLAESGGDLFDAVRRFESRRQLPANYVMKVDKASMSVSLEARAPYLDRRVAEIAYRAPVAELLGEGTNKLLLRRVAERSGLLPPEIARRPKMGGSIAASWLDEVPQFRGFARDVVLAPDGWAAEVGLRPAMEAYFSGRPGFAFPRALSLFSHVAWRLLLLELWSRSLGVERRLAA
ncbi:MAG: asparagine synthase (glutamine-hydrolyzing) [Thermoanaerobaculia bacterium]